MAEKFDGKRVSQRKARFVRSFVKSGDSTGKAASRQSVDELGREQQRRAVAYSRARGVL